MSWRCSECGCERPHEEILSEKNTGRGSLRMKITHCTNCGTKNTTLI